MDPSGLSWYGNSYGVTVSVSLTGITGVEGSASLVGNFGIGTGAKTDVGVQFSGGVTVGVNVGAGVGVTGYQGNLKDTDGTAPSVGFGAGPIGGSTSLDANGDPTGLSLTVGPSTRIPSALSLGYDNTKTYTLREDLIPAILGLLGLNPTQSDDSSPSSKDSQATSSSQGKYEGSENPNFGEYGVDSSHAAGSATGIGGEAGNDDGGV
jgi:hypothetical protein